MIYRIARPVVTFIVGQFYSRVVREGEDSCESGPLLVVCNHPNYLLDSLLVVSSFRRSLWFLAKSTLFQGTRGAFLEKIHMIPVYRKQDNPGEMGKNEDTFRRVVDHLMLGRGVALFPEGVSLGERQLAPIKSGAARMAFQTAEAMNFQSGLRIQPVGITYSDFDQFRSSVTVSYGTPIEVDSFREAFESDSIQAVRTLTEEIERGLRDETVELGSLEHQELVDRVAEVYASRSGTEVSDKERFQLIVENIRALGESFPEQRKRFESRISQYLSLCRDLALHTEETIDGRRDKLFTLLNMPFIFLGFLLHYPVYRLVGTIIEKEGITDLEKGSHKLVYGAAGFALLYLVVFLAVLAFGGSFLWAVTAVLISTWSGYCVNNYLQQARLLLLALLWPGRSNPIRIVRAIRDELIRELDELRVS